MSEAVRQKFEQWFALQNLRVTGNHLSIAEMQALRGPNGDYSKHAYMHGCWIGFCAAQNAEPLAGAA